MFKNASVVLACVLAAPMAWSQTDKQPGKDPIAGKLSISWRGQSFFSLKSTKGTVLVFDPHAILDYGPFDGSIKPDVILISHFHNDHTQIGIFEKWREKGDKPPIVIRGLNKSAGGRETWNIVDETIKDLHITSVGAYHDDVKGMKNGLTGIFIVEVDGWRFCHLGDLGHELSAKQLKSIGSVDVLMIPCGGIYGLNGSDARRVVDQIKPKQYILPMHIGNARYEDLLPVDEFIDDNPYPCAVVRDGLLVYSKSPRTNVKWLKENSRESDNTLVVEKHEHKLAIIVNLHYWPQLRKKKA